jgi:hypothetical protein
MPSIKSFKVASISSNSNSFGLYGHILMAQDGEAWQICRTRTGGYPTPWQKGEVVEVPMVLDSETEDEHPDWSQLHCEVPEQLTDAPPNVVAEVWGKVVPADDKLSLPIPKKQVTPSIVFTAEQFKPTQWNTAQDKADFANQFVRFVEGGFSASEFAPDFYSRLSQTFGHIAHFDRGTFFKTFFTCSADKLKFLAQTVEHESFGDPAFTFCDVERALRDWVIESKMIDRVAQTAINARNRAEREQLNRLLKKHGLPEDFQAGER